MFINHKLRILNVSLSHCGIQTASRLTPYPLETTVKIVSTEKNNIINDACIHHIFSSYSVPSTISRS